MKASRAVFGHSEKFIDRCYAACNSVDSIAIDAELRFDLLRALCSKSKSVETDQSVFCNCLRIVKLYSNRQSFVVTLERAT